MKTIIREICIMLLICICVILIFGIVFYEDIPISKITPNKVTYEVPDEIQEHLDLDVEKQEIQTQYIVYSVDGRDLKQYEDSGRLEEGKLDPFARYNVTNNNATITNNTPSSGGSSTSTNKNPNSVGTYYPNTGTK